MFTLIVTALAVLAVLGILVRIADSTTLDSKTSGSRALRPVNTPHLPLNPRDIR